MAGDQEVLQRTAQGDRHEGPLLLDARADLLEARGGVAVRTDDVERVGVEVRALPQRSAYGRGDVGEGVDRHLPPERAGARHPGDRRGGTRTRPVVEEGELLTGGLRLGQDVARLVDVEVADEVGGSAGDGPHRLLGGGARQLRRDPGRRRYAAALRTAVRLHRYLLALKLPGSARQTTRVANYREVPRRVVLKLLLPPHLLLLTRDDERFRVRGSPPVRIQVG